MTRIFHVVLDEKFIDNAISIFDSLPGVENEYLLVSRSGRASLIKKAGRLSLFASQFARLAYVWKHRPDIIVLHSLFFGATLLPLVSRRATLAWVSWGHDLYKDGAEAFASSYPFRHPLFMELTRKWKDSRKPSIKAGIVKAMKSMARNLFRLCAIRRIGYVSTCLPYEYPLIKEKYPHLRRFNFDYIDETALSLPNCDGDNILIGNSASINCNHLDILKLIGDRGISGGRLIVPLSYAGGEAYREAVIEAGTEAFGERFMALTGFMGIDEYTRLIRSCGFAALGFLRQQATKNIQLLLCQGTKIFFYKDAGIFRYFKDAGYSVFSVEDDLTPAGLGSRLPDDEMRKNRELALRQFGYAANVEGLKRSIEEIAAGRG
jgi:dTDP-N-acetylfucosamine:lipid II N-acetylfucosaminyltransferase